jgi:hypothetical protein
MKGMKISDTAKAEVLRLFEEENISSLRIFFGGYG